MLPLSSSEVSHESQDEFNLDIGVIYTHEREYMTPLLSTLARSGDRLRLRLILVDNASNEGVSQWKNVFPHTRVVRNGRRLGYAANLNRILEASTARYVLLLNTDMVFDPEEQSLQKMVASLDGDPQCGLAGCRLYHPDGTYGYPARRFPRLSTILARRFSRIIRAPQTLSDYLYGEHDRQNTFNCEWLSGCFLMLRRECYQQVGLFDEGFRKYFEDVDYCGRVAQANWQVKFFGNTYCYHWEQRDSARLFSYDSWLHIASYARWLAKRARGHYSPTAIDARTRDDAKSKIAPNRNRHSAPVAGPHSRSKVASKATAPE